MVAVEEEENEVDDLVNKSMTSLEDAEEMDTALGESLFESEFALEGEGEGEEEGQGTGEGLDEGEEEQKTSYQDEIVFGEMSLEGFNEGEERPLDYQEEQMDLILSDLERRQLWDEYKRHVDKNVFNELQYATLNR